MVEHTTLAGNGANDNGATLNFSEARDPNQVVLRFVNISGFRAGIYCFGGITAEYCYVHDLHFSAGSHNTGASLRAGNNYLRRNLITDGNSAAISFYPEYGPYTNNVVTQNILRLPTSDTGPEVLLASGRAFSEVTPGDTRELTNNLFFRGGNRGEGGGIGGYLEGFTTIAGNFDRLGEPVGPTVGPDPLPALPDLDSWPTTATTGVPDGVTLQPWTGSQTITTDNLVMDGYLITGALAIEAANVTIRNCRFQDGYVRLVDPDGAGAGYSFTIEDSEVHIGQEDHNWNTGIGNGNFTARRVEVTGGRRSMNAEYNSTIEWCLVHLQGSDPGGSLHYSGIRQGEGATIRYNSITCEAGRGPGTGCTAALTGYGDFGPVRNNLIERNLFMSRGGECTIGVYGGSSGDDGSKPYGHLAENIRFIDNVWLRNPVTGTFGTFGPVMDFDPARPGNVWIGNTYDDGVAIAPQN